MHVLINDHIESLPRRAVLSLWSCAGAVEVECLVMGFAGTRNGRFFFNPSYVDVKKVLPRS